MVRIILFLTVILNLYSAEVIYQSNVGGLNSKSSPLSVQDSEATDLLNINLDTDGALSKRNGYTQLNTSSLNAQVEGLTSYRKKDATLYMICAASNLYKMDSFDGTWDKITGSTAITGGTPFDFEVYQDVLVATNGVDIPQEWNGTGNAADSQCNADITLTDAKYVEQFKNRLFLGNVIVGGTSYPSRVYFSDIADKDTWNSINFLQIGVDDGEVITGMVDFADRLYVFKNNSIYRIRSTGDVLAPFIIEKTFSTEGCISSGSIQEVNNMVIFYSSKGLALFDGSRTQVISYKVNPTFDALTRTNIVNGTSGVFEQLNQYWLSVADGDSDDRVIVYDYYHDAFLVHSGIHMSHAVSVLDSSNNERFYTGDFTGYVYRHDQGANDFPLGVETAINSFYSTKNYTFDTFILNKVPQHVVVIYEYQSTDSTLNLNYTYDLSTQDWKLETLDQTSSGAAWDVAQWDIDVWPESGASFHRFDLISQGMSIRLKFSNNSLDEDFKLYGWSIGYDPGGVIYN